MTFGVESTAFFDKFVRSGKMTTKQGKRRVGSRLIPAVDYLQSQRLRMMMMTDLYEATKGVDCYLVASGPSKGTYRTPPKPGRMGEFVQCILDSSLDSCLSTRRLIAGGGSGNTDEDNPARRHSSMANLATYPAVNVPNGFDSRGSPTNFTIFAQPYKEDIVLGVAKIAQDAMGYHVMIPPKLNDAPLSEEEKEKLIAAEKAEEQKKQKATKAKQCSSGAKARL
jgi:hypothetical protein